MDVYKQFLYNIRCLELSETYITINEGITPRLKHYIKLVLTTEFNEGYYHTFYGRIKNIITSFNLYWTLVMDEAIKIADRYFNFTTKGELLDLVEQTINTNYVTHTDFGKDFLPIQTQLEKEYYELIQNQFSTYIEKLHSLIEQIKSLDKQENVQKFAEDNFTMSLRIKHKCFESTNNTIALYLGDNYEKIQISLEENFKRVLHNLKSAEVQQLTDISDLRIKLYESNKELRSLWRAEKRSSGAIAEVQKTVEILKNELTSTNNLSSNDSIKDECKYWKNMLKEFKPIKKSLLKIGAAKTKLLQRQHHHQSIKESPLTNQQVWENTNKKICKNFEDYNNIKLDASKAILTFFCVKGNNRILYSDNIGTYFVDSYGHQVYIFDYGLSIYHVNCEGKFRRISDDDKYYYDKYGRYVLKDDQKLYQLAPCTSTYKLDKGVFTKNSHNDYRHQNECTMEIKDHNDKVILPQVEPVNIKDTLDEETTQYLWTNLGAVLSQALLDVAELQPKNPIHCLAHKILYYKYNRSTKRLKRDSHEVEKYKEILLKGRKDKAVAAFMAWKEKQVKRRKPEESDDTQETHAFISNAAQQLLFNLLEY